LCTLGQRAFRTAGSSRPLASKKLGLGYDHLPPLSSRLLPAECGPSGRGLSVRRYLHSLFLLGITIRDTEALI
ncbi:MAG TPA: hypothetical protein PLN52_12660, partial [Opitutaceae bacterium]|nr:hypothetical protein [Opitutaceae bacterium]